MMRMSSAAFDIFITVEAAIHGIHPTIYFGVLTGHQVLTIFLVFRNLKFSVFTTLVSSMIGTYAIYHNDVIKGGPSLYYITIGIFFWSLALIILAYVSENEHREGFRLTNRMQTILYEQLGIFSKLTMGLVLFNDDSTVAWKNAACDEMFSFNPVEIGKRFGDNWITVDDHINFRQWLREVQESPREDQIEIRYFNGNYDPTQSHSLYITSANLHCSVGSRLLIMIRDTTAEKDANEFKSKWISTVSHEFRTPLNTLMNMIDHAEGLASEDQDKQFIQLGRNATNLLQTYVGDLLDYCQLRNKKFAVSNESFNIVNLIYNCSRMLEMKAKDKSIELKIKISPKLSKTICNDANRIQQILVNLIVNAIKFTPLGGTILISVEKETFGDDVKISVKDSGIGIKEDDQRYLFEEFGKVRNDETARLNPQGVGLGLWICKHICQQVGDGIYLYSRYGSGSTFTFTVANRQDRPRGVLKSSEIALSLTKRPSTFVDTLLTEQIVLMQEETQEDDHTLSNKQLVRRRIKESVYGGNPLSYARLDTHESVNDTKDTNLETSASGKSDSHSSDGTILVVDDEPSNRFIIETFCSKLGLAVDMARNGLEALTKISDGEMGYQLIILDYAMPEMNGPQVCLKLREMTLKGQLNQWIPILGYTAFTEKRDLDYFVDCGADIIIGKPISFPKFKEVLQAYLTEPL